MKRTTISVCVLLCYFSFVVTARQDMEHEKHLIKNLEESFVVNARENIEPYAHQITNDTQRKLRGLIKDTEINNLSAIMSISNYRMRDKLNTHTSNFKFGILTLKIMQRCILTY